MSEEDYKDKYNKLISFLKVHYPFEAVQGDSALRSHANSKIRLNDASAWLVSNGDGRSLYKMRQAADELNKIITPEKPLIGNNNGVLFLNREPNEEEKERFKNYNPITDNRANPRS